MRCLLFTQPYPSAAKSSLPSDYHGQLWAVCDQMREMNFLSSCRAPNLAEWLEDHPDVEVVDQLPDYRNLETV